MLIVSTSQGTEDLLIQEIQELGYKAHYLKPSKVEVEGKLEDVVPLSFYLRQAHKVGWKLAEGTIQDLEDVKKIVKEVDLSWLPKGSYAVRGRRIGEHPFTSMELAKTVADQLWPYFQKVNLDQPDWEFFAEVSENHFLLYLNLVGPSLHKRYVRHYQHAAPLKPSIAASLIYASSFRKKRELLDPMAGSGTIALEACYMAKNIPPGLFRDYFPYERLPGFTELKIKLLDRFNIQECEAYIAAGDISPKHVEGMKKNMNQRFPCDCVEIFQKDAGVLDYPYVPEVVIANPPYGLRMGSRNKIFKLYERFAQALRKQDVPEAIIFTAEEKKMRQELLKQGYQIEMFKRVLYGRLNTYLIKAVKEG